MPSVTPNSPDGKIGKEYWRSLDDFVDSPDFQAYVENEFPSQLENVLTPTNRRTFLKLMGASLALAGAGLSGCRRWPEQHIAPFAHRPEGYTPGEPVDFATAMEVGGVGRGLVAKSFDGRPIKVEGNPLDPIWAGSSDQFAQATTLQFYDPERSRRPLHRQNREPVDHADPWQAFRGFLSQQLSAWRGNGGRGVAILSEATSSPTFADMKRRVEQTLPNVRWYEYESLSRDNEIEGSRLSFGAPRRPQYDVSRADVLLCLDSDFLTSHPSSAKHARQFAERRKPRDGATMARLYAVEGTLSLTGANADHRLPVKSQEVAAVAALIARKLAAHGVSVLGAGNLPTPSDAEEKWGDFCEAVSTDLAARREAGANSLVVAGPRQPAEVHALVNAINFALGNVTKTVNFTRELDGERDSHVEALRTLADLARGNMISSLIILGGNPVYDAPADIDFAEVMAGLDATVHLSLYDDETSQQATWHVPAAHYLESWGDVRLWDGTIAYTQPLINPLYNGLSWIEMLALLIEDGSKLGHDLVRRRFNESHGGGDTDAAWRRVLHDGVEPDTAWPVENVAMQAGAWSSRLASLVDQAGGAEGMEVVFVQDTSVYDGRFANNGWLQELPDPIAKIAWDNAAFMSPATAAKIDGGVRGDDLVLIATGELGPLVMPVHIVPTHADDVITLNVGYGRSAAGHIGNGVGFDVGVLRTSDAMHYRGGVSVAREGGVYPLATVQDHHAMDTEITEQGKQERLPQIIREARLEQFRDNIEHGRNAFADPHHHEHELPILSLWEEYDYSDSRHKWAMTIDLAACTGCSACMIACQAENNIPVVGKDQVMRGREMHWIRVDRYYKGKDVNRPEVAFAPIPCMHCETAPCEQVCPVAATVHDTEGLNVMVYNRCVGTRYCSNNCPYKVRRFNYYDWHASDPRHAGIKPPALMWPEEQQEREFTGEKAVRKMQFNPDVTVRPRGVMEKCTYCLQRINRAKIEAKNEWIENTPADQKTREDARPTAVPDGAVTPACAQACPSKAIVFGDLLDPDSRVSKEFRNRRTYSMLEDLNTKPRTRFLGQVRNYNNSLKPYEPGGGHETDGQGEPHNADAEAARH